MKIYLIENIITHKIYIGQTVQLIQTRFLEHKSRAKLKNPGVKRGPMSAETKKKIGDAQRGEKNHRYGKKNKPFSEKRKQRMSEGLKRAWARRKTEGFETSDEVRKKISDGLNRAYAEGRGPSDTRKDR
jgi:hypothetical protein